MRQSTRLYQQQQKKKNSFFGIKMSGTRIYSLKKVYFFNQFRLIFQDAMS